MNYSKDEIKQYVAEEDVKFIRMAFCDLSGKQKNISIHPDELDRAFEYGIAFDASAIPGFGDEVHSDLFLHPDTATLCVLPWRPDHGRVVRMFCTVSRPNGAPFDADVRELLRRTVAEAAQMGISFSFGTEMEFYLFHRDEAGEPTKRPYDQAGYMDIAPDDKGENVRREISLTLEQMGIRPECSHHEQGPGQNEIDFRYSDALTAADNAVTFQTVVKTIAARNGLYADFSPKPIQDRPGSGFHINISVKGGDMTAMPCMIGGILNRISEMTLFLNPTDRSYHRLGFNKAPKYISWSSDNRSQLIRIPSATGEYRRAELRSPDPTANPYIAFALLIWAGLEGIANRQELPMACNRNLFQADAKALTELKMLPQSRAAAAKIARESSFIREHLPEGLLRFFCQG